jgi:superfamily II DNA or RNA helicase
MERIEFSERFLSDLGGWQALKHARALVDLGRVIDSNYTPPVLLGLVREGSTEFRAGLKFLSRTNVENLCSCRDSREWGTICAHSLAVALALNRPRTASAPHAPVSSARSSDPAATVASRNSGPELVATETGTDFTAYFILAPTFLAGWEKGQIMLGAEVSLGGRRVLASALDVKRSYCVSAQDAKALNGLRLFNEGKLPGMLILNRDALSRGLTILAGHPRITLGRDRKIEVATDPLKPDLLWLPDAEDGWQLEARLPASGNLFVAESAIWFWHENQFSPVAPGLPAAYHALLSEPIHLNAEQASAFCERELPVLKPYFTWSDLPAIANIEPGTPIVHLSLEGSLNWLTAKLQFLYGKRLTTFGVTSNSEPIIYQTATGKFSRNLRFEQHCAERIREVGFTGPATNGDYVLRGQTAILSFFATALPAWKSEWQVSIGSRFQNVTRGIERIQPRFEVTASGQDWFELSFELASGRGDRFSAADIQRLLQLGQGYTKLKDGSLAVFDPDAIGEIQEVLRDCQPDQIRPGAYRLNRLQAGFLDAALEQFGAIAPRATAWQDWVAAQRQLQPLQAADLGDLEAILRPYQKQGVYWLEFLRKNSLAGILADEMGLGKTLQTLAFIRLVRRPTLVVCPASLIYNWEREASRFTPELRVLRIEGPDRTTRFREIPEHDLIITSYPLLRRDVDKYRPFEFGLIVLDEATHIKNPETQNAQAAQALRGTYRLVLTGTPVENSVRDLWSIMNFLLPGYLGSREDFRERYELPISRGSVPERERLAKRLRPVMLRRLKRDVVAELPPKLEQAAYCDLTAEQRELYTKLQTAARQQIEELTSDRNQAKSRMLMLTTLLRLRQASCDLRLLGETATEPSAKLILLQELLEEAIDGGHRVLVFSQFVKMLHLIRDELERAEIPFCYLDGSSKERGRIVDRFQNDAEIPAFLISLKAGGVGLNLSAADTVFHFDPWWNPAVEDQATDRAHRIGQTRVVTSYKLIARGTVEEKIVQLQTKKREVIAAMVDSEEPLMTGLSLEEIAGLLQA